MINNIKKSIPIFIFNFLIKRLKKFHGLKEVDKKMLKYINYNDGFYIEMGAHDGVKHSNTFYYEKNKNWKGILIEPSNYFTELIKNRSKKNKFFKVICTPFNYKKKIRLNQYGDYSTCDELVTKRYLDWQNKKKVKVKMPLDKKKNIIVKTLPLNEILEKVKAPKVIDFFSLDVEGSELAVLKGINFKKFKFKYLLIEITFESKKLKQFLKKKNYLFKINITPWDYLFVPKK